MKIVADENIDRPLIAWLRSQGHDVLCVAEFAPGTSDEEILRQAHADRRVILTFDRDFGDLVFHRRLPTTGIIFLRLSPTSPQELMTQFQTLWPKLLPHLPGHFIVATPDKIRIRPLP